MTVPTTPQPAPVLSENTISGLLGEWMQILLTEKQVAAIKEYDSATTDDWYEWSDEKKEFALISRTMAFDNSTYRQLTYTRDLNAMAKVRAKMGLKRQIDFVHFLEELILVNRVAPSNRDKFALINADAATQARAAIKALGLGKGDAAPPPPPVPEPSIADLLAGLEEPITLTGKVDDFAALCVYGDLPHALEVAIRGRYSAEIGSVDVWLSMDDATIILEAAHSLELQIEVVRA